MSEVVAPILKMVYCVFLALSTNTGAGNHFSRLFDKDNVHMQAVRHDVFQFEVDLMCKDCKVAGRDPSKCRHMDYLNPSWNSAANLARCKAFIPDEKMFMREVQGSMTADETCIFGESSIQAFRERCRVAKRVILTKDDILKQKMTVFTMIDPNGGSKKKQSECAIVSHVRLKDVETIVIAGLASQPTVLSTQVEHFIKQYFTNWKNQMKHFNGIPHVLLVERNYGGTPVADLYQRYAKEIIPTIEEYHVEDRQQTAGVWTSEHLKHQSVTNMAWSLNKNKVHLASRICTDNVGQVEETTKKFLDQFGQTRIVSVGDKFKITGKMGNDPDDLGMTFILATLWSIMILLRGFCDAVEMRRRAVARSMQEEQVVESGFTNLFDVAKSREMYQDHMSSGLQGVLAY